MESKRGNHEQQTIHGQQSNHEMTEQFDNSNKDNLMIKSRKISIWRISIITILVNAFLFLGVQYVLNEIDENICSHRLIAFRNAVIYFEQIHNRFPTSYEELERETKLLGKLEKGKYRWVQGQGSESPQLHCLKHNRSSKDLYLH
ncbi:hypothetical protein BHU72_12520 [Desulfuribacillus stibiiarsenatis]|uniref:Uncharacterized protein n=1 Tax=Desulfuribacillus stibiiarsenatis TaxID=1390249 RepID=A0A1E5L2E6_9FIRM|nr:hypothetical protein [Desulfuribacillus stibiiarsenatis]OEH84221.1 hypothetical protein BHU72_12520 [Desulfuribacillus stibiiarsenatis]